MLIRAEKNKNDTNLIFPSSLNNISISRLSLRILDSRTRNNSANRTGSTTRIWLRVRSMETAIREVAVDFSGRNRAFIKHTLLYYINDIDSKKHNQPRDLLLLPLQTHPFDFHCGRVYGVYVCVISRARTHIHTRARNFYFYLPSLDSRNERFLINIGRRLFFAALPPRFLV